MAPREGADPLPGNASSPGGGDLPRKGLGLEIARRFAQTMGGAVTLQPREGGGMSARVELPAAGALGAAATGTAGTGAL